MKELSKLQEKNVVTLSETLTILWEHKIFISVFTFILSIIIFSGSFFISDRYKSEAILAAASTNSSPSNFLGDFSGIASVAGLSLPGSSSKEKIDRGLEILTSLYFFEKFSSRDNIFFNLVAVNGWDENDNKLLINSSIYNSNNKKWISKAKFSRNGRPSLQYAHRKFLNQLSVEKVRSNGFIKISFEHFSPFVAQQILESLILEINDVIKKDDVTKAENSINFLEEQIATTQILEVRSGFTKLIQSQIETIMLANASPYYRFEILSPPVVPELKSSPNRILIFILSILTGLFASSSFVYAKYIYRQSLN